MVRNSSADAQFSPKTCGLVAVGAEGLRSACCFPPLPVITDIQRLSPREMDGQGISQLIPVFVDFFPRCGTFFVCLFLSPSGADERRDVSQSPTIVSGEHTSDGLGSVDAVENNNYNLFNSFPSHLSQIPAPQAKTLTPYN